MPLMLMREIEKEEDPNAGYNQQQDFNASYEKSHACDPPPATPLRHACKKVGNAADDAQSHASQKERKKCEDWEIDEPLSFDLSSHEEENGEKQEQAEGDGKEKKNETERSGPMWARCLYLRSRLFFHQFAFHQTFPFRRGSRSSG